MQTIKELKKIPSFEVPKSHMFIVAIAECVNLICKSGYIFIIDIEHDSFTAS